MKTVPGVSGDIKVLPVAKEQIEGMLSGLQRMGSGAADDLVWDNLIIA